LRPFDVHLHYTDPRRLPLLVENELGLTYHASLEAMLSGCDVVAIHSTLHEGTARLFDADMIERMQRGAYLVNTSAAAICDLDAVGQALASGRLAGFASDSGFVGLASGQLVRNAGATLSAQARYAAGVREVLESWFDHVPIRARYLILDRGRPTATGIRFYGIGGHGMTSVRRL
jgi:formate dehydrogenase